MAWHEVTGLRRKTNRTYADDASPQRRWSAALAPLHYESDPASGVYDTAIDATPERVDVAAFDGWRVTANGWHYALGKDIANHGDQDGWLGFGGRQGQHWFKFRLLRVGYLHWPTRAWDDIGGAPNYDRANLSQEVNTVAIGPNADTISISTLATWSQIWTTPGGGSLDLTWTLNGDRLKENIIINQAGREWIEANHPPTTNPRQTWFGFVFQVDWSDVPQVYRGGVLQDVSEDFADDQEVVALRNALGELLAFMPLANLYVGDLEWEHDSIEVVPMRKRFWYEDGNHYVLVGVRCQELAEARAGPLHFDPTVNLATAASADDAKESEVGWTVITGSYVGLTAIDQWMGFRFPSCTIPKDSTISVADHQLRVANAANDVWDQTAYCEAADSAAQFTESGNPNYDISTRDTTTAGTYYSAETGGGYQHYPDLSDEVYEVVTRSGWSSGNPICILHASESGSPTLAVKAYDAGSEPPLFDITYTPPSGDSLASVAGQLRKRRFQPLLVR